MNKLTVLVWRETDSSPFESHVIQEHRLGPNLSPRAVKAKTARAAAERSLRRSGFTGEIEFIDGTPEKTVRDLPVSTARDNYGIKGQGAYRNNTPEG